MTSGGINLVEDGDVLPLLVPACWRMEICGLCWYQPPGGGWRYLVEDEYVWPLVVKRWSGEWRYAASVGTNLVEDGRYSM